MKKIYLLLGLFTSLLFAQNTYTKDDAGAYGGNSGFYETHKPNSTYPPGASSFWHLLDVRHTNVTNNFAMQFSGSFYDQNLWFRKTNNNAHRAWSKVVLENPQGNVGIGTSTPTEKFQVLNGNILVGNDKLQGGALFFGNPNHGFKRDYNTVTMYTAGHSESALTFDGASGEQMRINYKGDVGIGTSSPTEKLQVLNGNILVGNDNLQGGALFFGNPNHGFKRDYNTVTMYTAGHSESALTFDGASGEQMRINYKGDVGIGTSSPQNKLDVNGVIHSKEVKVDMDGWADYVFKKEYNLPTLQEVEQYIQEKGHLPSVPSEKEVVENGLSVGENQKLLLQKIEELTLYILQLNKEIQELKKN